MPTSVTICADAHAFDQQLDDAGLLGGKEFSPEWLECFKILAHLTSVRPSHSRRAARHGTLSCAVLQDRLADVVAVEPIALVRMRGREGCSFKAEGQAFQLGRGLGALVAGPEAGRSAGDTRLGLRGLFMPLS